MRLFFPFVYYCFSYNICKLFILSMHILLVVIYALPLISFSDLTLKMLNNVVKHNEFVQTRTLYIKSIYYYYYYYYRYYSLGSLTSNNYS